MKKRMKWEPAALMALVVGLGLWAVVGPGGKPRFPLRPDALTSDLRMGDMRGVLEAAKAPGDADYTFRALWRDQAVPPQPISRAQAEAAFGAERIASTLTPRTNWVFKLLNITSWTNLVWIGIGLTGQLAFSGRMVLQWIVSERKRESVISESFWWFSLFGGITLFCYFVWRADPIGILGQATGIVIYARNLRLIYKAKRRNNRSVERNPS